MRKKELRAQSYSKDFVFSSTPLIILEFIIEDVIGEDDTFCSKCIIERENEDLVFSLSPFFPLFFFLFHCVFSSAPSLFLIGHLVSTTKRLFSSDFVVDDDETERSEMSVVRNK